MQQHITSYPFYPHFTTEETEAESFKRLAQLVSRLSTLSSGPLDSLMKMGKKKQNGTKMREAQPNSFKTLLLYSNNVSSSALWGQAEQVYVTILQIFEDNYRICPKPSLLRA